MAGYVKLDRFLSGLEIIPHPLNNLLTATPEPPAPHVKINSKIETGADLAAVQQALAPEDVKRDGRGGGQAARRTDSRGDSIVRARLYSMVSCYTHKQKHP